MRTPEAVPHVETSGGSTPCSVSRAADRTVSSAAQPPSSSQSVAEIARDAAGRKGEQHETVEDLNRLVISERLPMGVMPTEPCPDVRP